MRSSISPDMQRGKEEIVYVSTTGKEQSIYISIGIGFRAPKQCHTCYFCYRGPHYCPGSGVSLLVLGTHALFTINLQTYWRYTKVVAWMLNTGPIWSNRWQPGSISHHTQTIMPTKQDFVELNISSIQWELSSSGSIYINVI